MGPAPLQLLEQAAHLLGLGNEGGGVQHLPNDHRRAPLEGPEHVLGVDDPGDVVLRALVGRDPREAALHDEPAHLAGRRVGIEGEDLGARHHDLAHRGVGQVEDPVDDVHLGLVQDPLLPTLPGQVPDLLLGDEAAGARLAGCRASAAPGGSTRRGPAPPSPTPGPGPGTARRPAGRRSRCAAAPPPWAPAPRTRGPRRRRPPRRGRTPGGREGASANSPSDRSSGSRWRIARTPPRIPARVPSDGDPDLHRGQELVHVVLKGPDPLGRPAPPSISVSMRLRRAVMIAISLPEKNPFARSSATMESDDEDRLRHGADHGSRPRPPTLRVPCASGSLTFRPGPSRLPGRNAPRRVSWPTARSSTSR